MHISLETCTSDVQSLRYDTWGNKIGLLLLNIMEIGNIRHVNQDLNVSSAPFGLYLQIRLENFIFKFIFRVIF